MGKGNVGSMSRHMHVGYHSAKWRRTASLLLTAGYQTQHWRREQIQLRTQPLQPGHNSLGKVEVHHLGFAYTLPWTCLHSPDVQSCSADTHVEAKREIAYPVDMVWVLLPDSKQGSALSRDRFPTKPPRQCVSMHMIASSWRTGLTIKLIEQSLIMCLKLYELWES